MNSAIAAPLTKASNSNSKHSDPKVFDNSFWDIKTAAEKLSVSEKTIRDWVYKRRIPFKKVGNLVRFNPSEIHQWVEERSHAYGN